MKIVIQIGEDKYLKSSIPFRLCSEIEQAEVWVDPKAARAFCAANPKRISSAKLIQIDAQLDFQEVPRLKVRQAPPIDEVEEDTVVDFPAQIEPIAKSKTKTKAS